MGKYIKIYISETIGGWNVTTTTRGIDRTDQVHRTDAMGTIIYGVHICIVGSLWLSVDG